MSNGRSAFDASPLFPDEDPTDPGRSQVIQAAYSAEVSAPDYSAPAEPARRFRLRIKDSRYDLAGETFFSLRDGELVEIGRHPSGLGNIRLVIDDPKVSQRHAYLLVKGTEILLFDGDPDTRKLSHNGTWFQLNGRLTKISGSQGLKIQAGANFRVGYTTLVLENFAG